MERKHQGFIFMTFIFSLIGAGLMIACLATQFWVEATPVRNVPEKIKQESENLTRGLEDMDEGKFSGTIHIGLFYGYQVLNHGFGIVGREEKVSISKYYVKEGIINFGLWVATIVFAGFSLVWGLVTMAFAILNINTKPIETLTGPMGLYLWSAFALFFTLLSILMWTLAFHIDLKYNMMRKRDRDNFWTSKDRAWLSYSFWMTVIACICYTLNFLCIYLSGTRLKPIRYKESVGKATMDGVMMY